MDIKDYTSNRIYILLLTSFIITQLFKTDNFDFENFFDQSITYEYLVSFSILVFIPVFNVSLRKLANQKEISIKYILVINYMLYEVLSYFLYSLNVTFISTGNGIESGHNEVHYYAFNSSFAVAYIMYLVDYLIEYLPFIKPKYLENIIIEHKGKLLPINVKDISIIYLSNSITYIVTSNGNKYHSNTTIKALMGRLNSKKFFRVNRKMILSRNAIKSISQSSNRKLLVECLTNIECEVVVPKERTSLFLNWVQN